MPLSVAGARIRHGAGARTLDARGALAHGGSAQAQGPRVCRGVAPALLRATAASRAEEVAQELTEQAQAEQAVHEDVPVKVQTVSREELEEATARYVANHDPFGSLPPSTWHTPEAYGKDGLSRLCRQRQRLYRTSTRRTRCWLFGRAFHPRGTPLKTEAAECTA